jgi:hypothetical protein
MQKQAEQAFDRVKGQVVVYKGCGIKGAGPARHPVAPIDKGAA